MQNDKALKTRRMRHHKKEKLDEIENARFSSRALHEKCIVYLASSCSLFKVSVLFG